MSMCSDHAQAIADKLAPEMYGREFHELTPDKQAEIFDLACKDAQAELEVRIKQEREV